MKNLTRKQILELGDMIADLSASEELEYNNAGFHIIQWALKYTNTNKAKFDKYMNNRFGYYYKKYNR